MHSLLEIIQNKILICAATAWFLAQALKIPTYWIVERKWEWKRFWGSGGMPSSHTAFVISLAAMTGFIEGFNTSIFALCVIFASVVMYDATGVRRETGNQAEIINKILRHLFVDGKPIADDDLKELVGHKPVEVVGGVIVGLLTAGMFLAF